jgi:uncharacterized protein YuzE
MKKYNFDYDRDNDDLFIFENGKKSRGAIEVGNFVIDFDEDENFVGLEITDAYEVLSKVFSKMIELTKITDLSVDAVNFRNMASLKLKITADSETETANIILPSIKNKSPELDC